MSHVYHPRTVMVEDPAQLETDEPLLFDDCEDCTRRIHPATQSPDMARQLWAKMFRVEFQANGRYRSVTEAQACRRYYEFALVAGRAFDFAPAEHGLVPRRTPLR